MQNYNYFMKETMFPASFSVKTVKSRMILEIFRQRLWGIGKKCLSLRLTKPVFSRTRRVIHDGILRPTMPFIGQGEGKSVYERYHSVLSNFTTCECGKEYN